jgi:hypothetical protein
MSRILQLVPLLLLMFCSIDSSTGQLAPPLLTLNLLSYENLIKPQNQYELNVVGQSCAHAPGSKPFLQTTTFFFQMSTNYELRIFRLIRKSKSPDNATGSYIIRTIFSTDESEMSLIKWQYEFVPDLNFNATFIRGFCESLLSSPFCTCQIQILTARLSFKLCIAKSIGSSSRFR